MGCFQGDEAAALAGLDDRSKSDRSLRVFGALCRHQPLTISSMIPTTTERTTSVEVPDWSPMLAPPPLEIGVINFVDGVRRVDARVITESDAGVMTYGIFGSVAVGAVRVFNITSTFDRIDSIRLLVLGSGLRAADQVVRIDQHELRYEGRSVAGAGLVAPTEELQNAMRTAEAQLAEIVSSESSCVFADGPLNFFTSARHHAVGIIKSLLVRYLEASKFSLVQKLKIGERTPIFAIVDGKYDRYSWYLRLGYPGTLSHSLAGVIRLEVRAGVGLAAARHLADYSGLLPSFVADTMRDPRAPQNLLPIGALEQELRHRLGDPAHIRRAIEVRLFEGVEL